MSDRIYAAIDLKSFYASVECVERGLDPLSARLVVADRSRTEKTICLAVSPALKAVGIPGRPRLFEVVQKAKEAGIDYITALPRMAKYMEYSTRIYRIYLSFIAPEDIHVYSIDEVFLDLTDYLGFYHMSAHELVMTMIRKVLKETGITATAGIGTNLYLCKIAMDIVAKKMKPDRDGVRIAELDERSYREQLWDHRPLTDFWRIGRGYAKKLEENGLMTMGDVARCSIGSEDDFYNEDLLYRLFGKNTELLIDHAWGYEDCTMEAIKSYKSSDHSLSQGQVLTEPYDFEKGRIIIKEMAELLSLDLVVKGLVTDQIVLTVGYDIQNLMDPEAAAAYGGEVTLDYYGRAVPKHAHGTCNIAEATSSTDEIIKAALTVYDKKVDKKLLIRRVYVVACHVRVASEDEGATYEQMDLFTDYAGSEKEREEKRKQKEREEKLQNAMIDIKLKYGKNAILKGTNLQEGATMKDRNRQIGGHRA